MSPRLLVFAITFITILVGSPLSAAPATQPIAFNTNFQGAAIGQIEPIDDATFRCHVEGQADERGHNRQGSWFFFRMDHVLGRDITVTLVYILGEYNGKPAKSSMAPGLNPVFSDDGVHWQHFPEMAWDEAKHEATLHLHPKNDSIWLAHIPPYTPADLDRLLADVNRSPDARVEVVGKTVHGRDLMLVTVTDSEVPDEKKKVVWLIAREHAWEAGTSHVMEGALRFITSDDPTAKRLREHVIFKFSPMVDVDGCAEGKVRFNANSYDVNRHWDVVDLRNKEFLRLMPEIWYAKKTILTQAAERNGHGIDLMVNMHNTETSEYLDTEVDDPATMKVLTLLDALLTVNTQFDPSSHVMVRKIPADTTNVLWVERRVPVALMELRTGISKKLSRQPTVDDNLNFGRQLISQMGWAVLPEHE